MKRLLAAVAVALVSAGCAPGGSPPPSPPAATPATITAGPERSAGYADRTVAMMRVDNGDGLAMADGAVWVKTDDGRVVRVDPATNRVSGQVHVDTSTDPSAYCQGIGVVDGALWACSATATTTDVVEVDTTSLAVRRRVPVNKVFDQLALPATAGSLWVLSHNGIEVTRLDAQTGEATAAPLGARCLQLAAGGGVLVATCATQSRVLLLDVHTGQVVRRATLADPRVACVLDGDVWVDTATGLTRLREDLSVAATYPSLHAGLGGDLVAAAGAIWLRTGDGTITEIDPTSGQPVEQIAPETDLTPGSLLVTDDSIWTTSGDDGLLYRLRRA